MFLWTTHCHICGIAHWQPVTVVHGLPKSVSSRFHLLGQVSSTSPLPLILLVLLPLCSDSDLTESLRPREYLSNVKLSGLVVDVASVASAAPFSSEAPIDGRG